MPRSTQRPAGRSSRPRRGTARGAGEGFTAKEDHAVRYAVIGLGHIAQTAVLPAFRNARENSRLTALISDDPTKRRTLSRRYNLDHAWDYDELDEALASDTFDAVYIAVPNHLHHEYTIRAARAGKHVLCEKPMALTVEHCEDMIRTAEAHGVRLMVAYRLHLDDPYLAAHEVVNSGRVGEPRFLSSVFGMNVKEGDIRLRRETGGGTLWDIGIYCINAARSLFRDEPLEVYAVTASNGETRFQDVEEMAGAVLRFPGERLASFTVSFGCGDVADLTVVGSEGLMRVEQAYNVAETMRVRVTSDSRTTPRTYSPRDQFAPELIHFSDCILHQREPEPSGLEGLIDVSIIRALYDSADAMKPVEYNGPRRNRRPRREQAMRKPAHAREPELVHASSPDEA